jgi:hypothetical protein
VEMAVTSIARQPCTAELKRSQRPIRLKKERLNHHGGHLSSPPGIDRHINSSGTTQLPELSL